MILDATALAGLLSACAPSVAPQTMTAIMSVESKGKIYSIGVNSGVRLRSQPTNKADAIATVRGLLARGANFDAGLMQINSSNWATLGLTPETVFDPCTNIRAGAAVLSDNYRRARSSGHSAPLQAALSEYNTGSRTRGLANGYVSKVYAAAGRPLPRATSSQSSRNGWTTATVSRVILSAFGGRITDTTRPMNASYGAANSHHKYGRAIDFVPRGGMSALTKADIRAVAARHGIPILELLGPGDAGHSDHWHLAFGNNQNSPISPTILAKASPSPAPSPGLIENKNSDIPEAAPPTWNVFAYSDWARRQTQAGAAQ